MIGRAERRHGPPPIGDSAAAGRAAGHARASKRLRIATGNYGRRGTPPTPALAEAACNLNHDSPSVKHNRSSPDRGQSASTLAFAVALPCAPVALRQDSHIDPKCLTIQLTCNILLDAGCLDRRATPDVRPRFPIDSLPPSRPIPIRRMPSFWRRSVARCGSRANGGASRARRCRKAPGSRNAISRSSKRAKATRRCSCCAASQRALAMPLTELIDPREGSVEKRLIRRFLDGLAGAPAGGRRLPADARLRRGSRGEAQADSARRPARRRQDHARKRACRGARACRSSSSTARSSARPASACPKSSCSTDRRDIGASSAGASNG